MDIEIIRIGVEAVLGCTTVLGFILYHRQTKRVKNAEALKSEIEADASKYQMYEERLEHCNQAVENHNQTIINQTQTIADLNDTINSKTARIRELTDALYQSESELNKVNAQLVEKTERIGKLELLCQKYKDWRCVLGECPNRKPANPKLKGLQYDIDDPTI